MDFQRFNVPCYFSLSSSILGGDSSRSSNFLGNLDLQYSCVPRPQYLSSRSNNLIVSASTFFGTYFYLLRRQSSIISNILGFLSRKISSSISRGAPSLLENFLNISEPGTEVRSSLVTYFCVPPMLRFTILSEFMTFYSKCILSSSS